MSHQPAPAQPRRIPRTLATLGGLALFLIAAIGLAPAASATPAPPDPSFAPAPPLPPAAPPAQFPPWAITAILAATIVLSVATTLITLALEYARWARREAAANPEPQASPRTPITTPAQDPLDLRDQLKAAQARTTWGTTR